MPILTDSGGFQVMSLSQLRKIDECCVTFRSHLDGAEIELSPERAIEIQRLLGADIVMQLDECLQLPAPRSEIERAMVLSLRWAERSKRAFERMRPQVTRCSASCRAATIRSCASTSARALVDIGFRRLRHRRARGRRAAGGDAAHDRGGGAAAAAATAALSDGRRHAGRHLVEAVARGIDMFDCVLPTRNGRHGLAFTRFGPINLKNARHADDPRPLDAESACPAARDYSRAYLHHLVKANEMLGAMLLSMVNLAYYQDLMAGMRMAISAGRFEAFREAVKENWARSDIAPF